MKYLFIVVLSVVLVACDSSGDYVQRGKNTVRADHPLLGKWQLVENYVNEKKNVEKNNIWYEFHRDSTYGAGVLIDDEEKVSNALGRWRYKEYKTGVVIEMGNEQGVVEMDVKKLRNDSLITLYEFEGRLIKQIFIRTEKNIEPDNLK